MKEQSAAGILETTIEKVKNLVNVSTIIGEPMNIDGGITIIPVSKVTYGFASGGSDFPSKTNKEIFGGGGGAGVRAPAGHCGRLHDPSVVERVCGGVGQFPAAAEDPVAHGQCLRAAHADDGKGAARRGGRGNDRIVIRAVHRPSMRRRCPMRSVRGLRMLFQRMSCEVVTW